MIYLDNAATTSIHYGVLDAMWPFLGVFYGNAGSLHSKGREAYNAVQNARKQVADFIGASPEQIIFTSGGTEANNMIANFASHLGMNFVMSSVEHDSIIESVKLNHIERDNSACFCHVHSDGIVDLDTLEFILKNANCSSFVSIMLGHKNSPQEPIKVKIASTARVGFTIGIITFTNISKTLQPSTTAASSTSLGILRKACRIKNIPKALTAKGITSPIYPARLLTLSIKCSFKVII